jgi:hypothetical protein
VLAELPTAPDATVEAELLWWARKGLLDVEDPGACAALSTRMRVVAGSSGYHAPNATLAAIVDHLVLAEPEPARAASEVYTAMAEASPAPLTRYISETLRAMWALYEGRFDDVAAAAVRAEAAKSFGGLTSLQVVAGQRVLLARELGQFRDDPELLALVESLIPVDGPIPLWSAATAWLRADVGDDDVALEVVRRLAQATEGFADIARGPHRLPLLAMVAETLSEIDARGERRCDPLVPDLAARVYRALDAHPAPGVLLGWPVGYLGTKQRYLALAAGASGDDSAAVRHLDRSRRAHPASSPLGVRDQLAWARLLCRGREHARAGRVARTARLRATALGMTGVAADAASMEERTAQPSA